MNRAASPSCFGTGRGGCCRDLYTEKTEVLPTLPRGEARSRLWVWCFSNDDTRSKGLLRSITRRVCGADCRAAGGATERLLFIAAENSSWLLARCPVGAPSKETTLVRLNQRPPCPKHVPLAAARAASRALRTSPGPCLPVARSPEPLSTVRCGIITNGFA